MIKAKTIKILDGLPEGILQKSRVEKALVFESIDPMVFGPLDIDLSYFVELVFKCRNLDEFINIHKDQSWLSDLYLNANKDEVWKDFVELAHWLHDNLWD